MVKETFKEGDWVFILEEEKYSLAEGEKFDEILHNCLQVNKVSNDCVVKLSGIECTLCFTRFRHAFPHEIPSENILNTLELW